MAKTALITGITGQDGAYLAQLLVQKKYHVIGLTHSPNHEKRWRLKYLGINDRIEIITGSLLDTRCIKKILQKYQPQEIYNLAGESSVKKSWEHPEETFLINGFSVLQLLEYIRAYSPQSRLFQASSAEIFGNSQKKITEKDTSFSPLNPYATAKLSAHMAVKNYRDQYNLFVTNGILFTHTSPVQIETTFAKNIVHGVSQIAMGTKDHLAVGDMHMHRDFSFAGDIVQAMWCIMQEKHPHDFVISSGTTRSIEEFIASCFEYVGIKKWQKYIQEDKKLRGKGSIQKMSGSNRALKKIGWKPKVNFKQLVHMMMDFELQSNKKYDRNKT